MEIFTLIIFIVAGYLIGSIPTGYILAKKFRQIDIRRVGSGNIGATNVARILGKRFGLLTLAGDFLKAFIFVFIVRKLFDSSPFLYLASLSVLAGNCHSIFLKFSGGKGGATTFGVFFGLTPFASLITVAIYILLLKITKISAIGTLSSTFLLPILISIFHPPHYIPLACIFTATVWIKHRQNIKRLLKGEERKLAF
jgi:glycerol-3-phosphate acyltransferase PlsY